MIRLDNKTRSILTVDFVSETVEARDSGIAYSKSRKEKQKTKNNLKPVNQKSYIQKRYLSEMKAK